VTLTTRSPTCHLIKLGTQIFGIASDGPIKMMNDKLATMFYLQSLFQTVPRTASFNAIEE
jgi:hypothetical protein